MDLIKSWAEGRVSTMQRAYCTKGGWETWAQVDLALYAEQHSKNLKFEREVMAYLTDRKDPSLERADFIVTIDGREKQVVEFKVDLQTGSELVERFEVDIKKAQKLMNEKYKDAQVFAIAIALTKKQYDQILKKHQADTQHFDLPSQSAEKCGVFIWRKPASA